MKRLIFLPLIALVLGCYSQSVKISALPADAVLDSNDYFLENHQATTTSKMAGITIMDYAYGVGDSVRGELADTAAALRGEITGAAGWTKSGTHIYETSTLDSLGIGTATPTEKLDIVGSIKVSDNLRLYDTAKFGTYQDAYIFTDGSGNLTLEDAFVGSITLYDLLNLISNAGSLLTYQSGHLHLGGSATRNTTLNTAGYTFYLYGMGGNSLLDMSSGYIELQSNEAILTGLNTAYMQTSDAEVKIETNGDIALTAGSGDDIILTTTGTGYVSTQDLAVADTFNIGSTGFIYQYNNSNIFFSPSGNTTISKQPFFATNAEPVGVTLGGIDALKLNYDDYMKSFRNDSTRTAYDDSTAWSASAIKDYVAGNAGSGDVSVSGTPSAGQIALWTDASTIEGKDSLKWINGRIEFIGKSGDFSIGYAAGQDLTGSNKYNTNVGHYAGYHITEGGGNVNLGHSTGRTNTLGDYNVNIGYQAGYDLDGEGTDFNINIGSWAGENITTGTGNINIGRATGDAMTTGKFNVAIGYLAGVTTTTGSNNIFIGDSSGYNLTESTSHNLFIESSNANKFNSLIWGDFANDSLRLNGKVRMKDSTYFDYIAPGGLSTPTFMVLTVGKAADSSTISGAKDGVIYADFIPDFEDYYSDTLNGERRWYFDFKNGKWISQYGLNLNDPNSLKALQMKLEFHDTWIMRAYRENRMLEIQIRNLELYDAQKVSKNLYYLIIGGFLLFIGIVIYQQIKLSKLSKRLR